MAISNEIVSRCGRIGRHNSIDGTIPLPTAPTAPATGVGSTQEWNNFNKIALSFIANRLDNSQDLAEAWSRLDTLYQAQDAITKMYLNSYQHLSQLLVMAAHTYIISGVVKLVHLLLLNGGVLASPSRLSVMML